MINISKDWIQQRKNLIKELKDQGRIYSKSVENAFLNIPRELFISEDQKQYAYDDRPLNIGLSQTISAPHMVAIMVEAIDFKRGQRILEIGAGSGYHAAIVAQLIGKNGSVYSIERIPTLAEFAEKNLTKAGIQNVNVICADGSVGLPQHAPFDHIYVTCAAPSIPQPLIDQLKQNGSLLIPVGRQICDLQKITKIIDDISIEHLGGCAFVPLIGKLGF